MNRKTIKLALYKLVELTDINRKTYKGWLVPKGKEYLILPANRNDIFIFVVSDIKNIRFISNDIILD